MSFDHLLTYKNSESIECVPYLELTTLQFYTIPVGSATKARAVKVGSHIVTIFTIFTSYIYHINTLNAEKFPA